MPKKREYLPYGLTEKEKADPKLRKKLASCIKQVEKKACKGVRKKNGKYDYSKCLANPVAVCRASISGTKSNKNEKVEWHKIKAGKITKISKPKSIDALLEQGYTVGKTTEVGNKTIIKTYSPLTKQEHWVQLKKQFPYSMMKK